MSVASDLNRFTHLKHLYCNFHQFGNLTTTEKANFAFHARNLAEAVPGLVNITNVSSFNRLYTVARITRGENEQVSSVEVGNGRGMKIGYEDQAFP
jgi:hypothetical protein